MRYWVVERRRITREAGVVLHVCGGSVAVRMGCRWRPPLIHAILLHPCGRNRCAPQSFLAPVYGIAGGEATSTLEKYYDTSIHREPACRAGREMTSGARYPLLA